MLWFIETHKDYEKSLRQFTHHYSEGPFDKGPINSSIMNKLNKYS